MDNYEHDVLRLPDRYYIVGVRGSEHFEQVGWDLSWNKEMLASPQEKKNANLQLDIILSRFIFHHFSYWDFSYNF